MKKTIVASVLFFALLLAGCIGVVVSERPVYEYQIYQLPERRPSKTPTGIGFGVGKALFKEVFSDLLFLF